MCACSFSYMCKDINTNKIFSPGEDLPSSILIYIYYFQGLVSSWVCWVFLMLLHSYNLIIDVWCCLVNYIANYGC